MAASRDVQPTDIFVSYTPADERWATWIAWELEAAGYRTMLQAWDFVPGTNFIDSMDRGLREASLVIALLSRGYLASRYGRMEWMAALNRNPEDPSSHLVTVRIEECELDPLLSPITWVDLVGVNDDGEARGRLLSRIRDALSGRAKPEDQPPSPWSTTAAVVPVPPQRPGPELSGRRQARRIPVAQPAYPPAAARSEDGQETLTVLHVAGPRFGRALTDEPHEAGELQSKIWADVTHLRIRPDLLVVTGNLTESGSRRESAEATSFLSGLRTLLGLEAHRVVIVPGAQDVTRAASRSYFDDCEADDLEPQPPYWPKWRHFSRLFTELYRGLDTVVFDSAQPWTLFPIPELKTVVAGINSTMAESHRPEDHYGLVGHAQAAWFAERMRPFGEGWLRIGVLQHSPLQDDPNRLSDAETLDRLLGPSLDLIIHGVAAEPGELVSGTLCIPALKPGHHQILQIDREGLTRWIRGRHPAPAEPERTPRTWRTPGLFQPARPAVPAIPPPAETPEPQASPVSMLLDQVAEACETRFDRARVRRVPIDPPQLLVSYPEDEYVRQVRIGAHIGEVTAADLEAFVGQIHAAGAEHGSELVYVGPAPAPSLREAALRSGVRLRSLMEFQGLLDLTGYVDDQTARLRASPLYPPDLYVPQRYRDLDTPAEGVREDLAGGILDLLTGDHGRFLLLLGDFGRGKTFALREVARRIATETPHLVPILIELRTLDKAHSVDALVAAHLANHGEDYIDLKAFHYMLRQGRIVLLFDGFDELVTRVTYERAADHLDTLLRAAEGKAKIVVAGRTQHFKSHTQVFTTLGERVGVLSQRRVFSIENFTPTQVRSFLVNRYGSAEEADRRLELLRGIEDLLGLAQNPRMLGFIADLPEQRLRGVAAARRTVSAADLYREILDWWLAYEEHRARAIPGAAGGLSRDQMWQAARILALRLWEANEPYLRLEELSEVAETLMGLADTGMSTGQTAHVVGAGGLMVRTDEDLFGFIHASVMEWLVAEHIAREFAAGRDPAALSRRPLSQLTIDFVCDLADARACQRWADAILADAASAETPRGNAFKLTTRLRTPAHTDLRGAKLRGEDLSYRDLSQVDLTGADLSDAQLVGANLTRAVLRNATLAGARLDEARLTGADLRGADLSRAKLAQVDLRDADITGSTWTRAALIAATAGPRLFTAPELRGAAIAPGHPVEVQFAPSAVGVPYGFHFSTGRLPSPVAYSPDGTMVALGSEDGGVMICDARSGLPLRTLLGHRDRTYAVVYSGSGDLLVTGSADGTARLWDTATGRERHRLDIHPEGVWPVLLDPAGRRLATGDAAGVVRIWDVATGELTATFPGHTPLIYTAAFSPDGMTLVTGDAEGAVRVWSLTDNSLVRTLDHEGSVYRLLFAPDGSLVTGDSQGCVRISDLGTGETIRELRSHTGRVYALAIHGDMLASGDTDGGVNLWSLSGRTGLVPLTGHTGGVYQVAFAPDGRFLGTADSNGSVRMWDPRTGQQLNSLSGHRGAVWPFAFRPDGAQLATTSNDGTARLWDTATGQMRRILRGHGRRITSVTFSPDGSALASSGNDGVVRLWDPRTGRMIKPLHGDADRLTSASYSLAGGWLATASNDGGVYLRQAGSGRRERELSAETDHVWAQAFSPDGTVLATANDDDSVRLWYHTTGREVANLADHRGRVRSIDYSPDGLRVATGCDDGRVRVWDATTGQCLSTLEGHTDRVYQVMFDHDGAVLASASNDGTARLWDHVAGRTLHTLTRHQGRLWSAAFSPDGRTLATAGDDLVVRLWDAGTGQHLHTLTGHTRRIWSVAFSPDGRLLASGGDDGSIILWNMGEEPARRSTLLGLAEGWAALGTDGRYKYENNVSGEFWFAVGMCRFEAGELDPYLSEVEQIPLDAEL